MERKTLTKALLISGLTCVAASPLLAADKALMTGASATMLANTCAGCHGGDGASGGPATPVISGLSKTYFTDIMSGFASDDVPSTIMGRIAKGYSEDEFGTMADYFAAKPFVDAKQTFDAKLAKNGAKLHDKYCEKCHSEGGESVEDDSGRLAGQWTPYLKWSLQDFTSGERTMPKKMKKRVNKMLKKKGDAAITALLNYYASEH